MCWLMKFYIIKWEFIGLNNIQRLWTKFHGFKQKQINFFISNQKISFSIFDSLMANFIIDFFVRFQSFKENFWMILLNETKKLNKNKI